VYWSDEKAVVVGDLQPLTGKVGDSLWLETKAEPEKKTKVDPENLTRNLAHALVLRKIGFDQNTPLAALAPDEFSRFIDLLNDLARLNQQTKLGRNDRQGYENAFQMTKEILEKIPLWEELVELSANTAQSARRDDLAVSVYRTYEMQLPLNSPERSKVIEKLAELNKTLSPKVDDNDLGIIKAHVEFAAKVLNELFDTDIGAPPVVLVSRDMKNAWWDRSSVYVPPQTKDLPDIIYHEVSYLFIESLVKFNLESQSGSLMQSYADILTSVIKQRKLNQTAQQADWTIAPGAIAWLRGEELTPTTDRSPLRSMKEPGTAYNDPVIGRDPQPRHMKDLVQTNADNGGVHINAGIPNRAFYLAAIKLNTTSAAKIWVEGLRRMKVSTDFYGAAMILRNITREEFGPDSTEFKSVNEAWSEVGLSASAT
jgi:hypothetical protein